MKKGLYVTIILLILLLPINIVSAASSIIVDDADLFTSEEEALLEKEIKSLKSEYQGDFVIWTTNEYYDGDVKYQAADYYDYNDYASSGIILLINMNNRQLAIVTTGIYENKISQRAIEEMLDEIAPHLSDGDYYAGAESFLSSIDQSLYVPVNQNTSAKKEPKADHWHGVPEKTQRAVVMTTFLVSGLATWIFVRHNLKRMKFQGLKKNASDYKEPDTFNLKVSRDVFLHRDVTRHAKPKNDPPSNGGSFHSSSGISHGGGSRGF